MKLILKLDILIFNNTKIYNKKCYNYNNLKFIYN